jgi:bacillithiol biosynthesis cysteine-adding enzyme BshC
LIKKISAITFQKTGYFSKTICDYLDKKEQIRPYYDQFPDIEGFKHQITEKEKSYSESTREILVEQLRDQYHGFEVSDETGRHLDQLLLKNTFTVTTGHQLNLFTGPLYFLYKIVTAINLAKKLKKHFPGYNFVPVFWMAAEDHDFEEIRFFNFKGKRIKWNRDAHGAVGPLSNEGLDKVFEEFSSLLSSGNNAGYLKELFQKSYLEHKDLSAATRYLANELFGKYGLVILDGNNKVLKKEFIPFVKEELLHQTCFKEVSRTVETFKENYKIPVNPREINLFYLDNNLRERIVLKDGIYKINNTVLSFTKEEIFREVETNPEKFSPNVLMRPLYEEVILPNLCYIGGGGELSYWMELKAFFDRMKVPFPVLLLRNSVLLIHKKQNQKLQRLGVSFEDIFLERNDFINKKVRENSDLKIDFSEQKERIAQIFKELEVISHCTERSFLGAVKAQEQKQLNGLDHLEKRLLRAQKRKLKDLVDRISVLHHQLFPNEVLQERYDNFSEYYLEVGDELIQGLVEHLDPLETEFNVLEL